MSSVYLCGPIAGLNYEEARNGWRKEFRTMIDKRIDLLSPMRQEGHLAEIAGPIGAFAPDNVAIATQRAIVAKDKLDIRRADLVVANFINAGRVSIGSVAEIGFASALDKPIILIMEPESNIHDHVFIREMADIRVSSVEEAAAIVDALLLPGV
jgi:nucleoside 2-deoxyribosyltransferase